MELTPKQRSFLEAVHFAVGATIGPDGTAHQTVVWYMLEGERLLLNTPSSSQKHRHHGQNLHGSVCVEDAYTSLTLQATVRLEQAPIRAHADYARFGDRYRGTSARRRPTPDTHQPGGRREHPRLLPRERVSLWLEVDRVIENKFGR